ncbi:MAG UNVERIFIED_CONTAM: hypothetical protein LVR18_42555 [Planctomycetaceae bacterium]|jgi:hypothetical protein
MATASGRVRTYAILKSRGWISSRLPVVLFSRNCQNEETKKKKKKKKKKEKGRKKGEGEGEGEKDGG